MLYMVLFVFLRYGKTIKNMANNLITYIKTEVHYLLVKQAEKNKDRVLYISGEQHIVDYLKENLHVSDRTATEAVKQLLADNYIYFNKNNKEILHVLDFMEEDLIYSPRPQYILDTNLLSDKSLHVTLKDWNIWSYCMNFAKHNKAVFMSYSKIAKSIGAANITSNSVKYSLDKLSRIMGYKIVTEPSKKCGKVMDYWFDKNRDGDVKMHGFLLEKRIPTKDELRERIDELLTQDGFKTIAECKKIDLNNPLYKNRQNKLKKRKVRRLKFLSYSGYAKVKQMQAKEKKNRKKINWRTTLRQYVRLAFENVEELKRRMNFLGERIPEMLLAKKKRSKFKFRKTVFDVQEDAREAGWKDYMKENRIRWGDVKWVFGAPPLERELYGFEYDSGLSVNEDGNII